ncbi:MAG: fatty acid desaturase [Myxococcota bacterium]
MLRYQADRRTIFFVGLYFSFFLGLWLFVPDDWFWTTDLLLLLPVIAFTAVLSFMGAVATHNAVHSPVFKKRWHNKVFQVVLTMTYGHPVSSYVPGHNLSHHKHTQTRRDVMRTTKARFRWNLLNGLFFPLLVGASIVKGEQAYFKRMKKRLPRWFTQFRIELYTFWTLQIGLFILDWRKALIFWLIPHLYAQWGIVTMNLLQHDGCDETSRYNHSRNFVGKLVNWWTYNNGFHSIHHDLPGLHWSLCPEKHREVYGPHIHPNLEQKSLLLYIFRTFILNQRLAHDGTPYQLPEEGPDEEWIPKPEETLGDLGAEGMPSLST